MNESQLGVLSRKEAVNTFYKRLAQSWPGFLAQQGKPLGQPGLDNAVRLQRADLAALMRESEAMAKAMEQR